MKNATDVFAQKNFPKDIFNSKICHGNDYLVIGPRVVQGREGVIMLVISNRPCASRSFDFEITRAISNSNWQHCL